jgi:hypothetical protein
MKYLLIAMSSCGSKTLSHYYENVDVARSKAEELIHLNADPPYTRFLVIQDNTMVVYFGEVPKSIISWEWKGMLGEEVQL